MNKRSIVEARDADLRLSIVALERAARRARELAVSTGTALIVSRNGAIECLEPAAQDDAAQAKDSDGENP